MRSVGPVIITIRSITILAWAAVIYDALPWWPYLPDATSRLAMVAAIAGTCKYLSGLISKPAHEVYEAGKAMGRAELLREQANADAIVHLDERRKTLRKVGKGERRIAAWS